MPEPDGENRTRLRAMAVKYIDSKPRKLCSELKCVMLETLKQAWQSTHRRVRDNGHTNAAGQDEFEKWKMGNPKRRVHDAFTGN